MDTKTLLKLAVIAMALIVTTGACKSSKKATETTYTGARGIAIQTEECIKMALNPPAGVFRGSGNAIADREQFAVNQATMEARASLARQLEVLIEGLIQRFDQEHDAGNASSSVGKGTGITREYVQQFVTNSRPICQNTYDKDGKFNVYVAVEMSEEQTRNIYKKLREDQKISIDFQEHQFLKELERAKEEYNSRQ
ncbi:MAG: hypothetical protein FWE63_03990 [Bacteroidales bacterium]|nr:hypothetical protein [Bacteroidales bacterium]